ncbi:hypothetical protein AN9118.2 [Aspergillus nidulans FGSC A4]|nr:hypothetical protein AN9118.2 [Aspergillus nidulans FGSC A4]|eukprot:XP_682387.1 hypothetical protein AN9118.2 [Aspergillus nidulans FGSC A4]
MAPKHSEKSFFSAAYEQITSPEHKTIVRSILVFGAGVAFLHSSLSELLLPPGQSDVFGGHVIFRLFMRSCLYA